MSDLGKYTEAYTIYFIRAVKKSPAIAPPLVYYYKRSIIKYNFSGFVGEQGSGKSYSAIMWALLLDKDFTFDNIIFSSINFLDALDELEKSGRKGRFIIWDDAGVGLPASEWQSISNKVIQLVMQTVRVLHPSIIFTMPDLGYLDPKQRKSLSSVFVVKRTQEDESVLRFYTKRRIYLTGEEFTKRFTVGIGAGRIKYRDIRIKHAPLDILPDVFKEYEEIQKRFKYKTREKLKRLLEGGQELKTKYVAGQLGDLSTVSISEMERRLVYEIYQRVWKNYGKYINMRGKIDKDRIMLDFHVNSKIARIVKRFADKKLHPDVVKRELDI